MINKLERQGKLPQGDRHYTPNRRGISYRFSVDYSRENMLNNG